jgi:hypothetical protein
MADEGQVTQTGDQVVTDQQSQSQSLGWRAALPDEYKEHEFVKTFQKPGDFVKSALDIKTERDGLKTRLENTIPKLNDKSTPEEVSTYRKAMGVPDKPEGYEFPQIEGKENSPEMVKWAQGVFHKYQVSKDSAKGIGQEWNSFVAGMVEAEDKLEKEEFEGNQKKFREQFKSEEEYNAGYKLAQRFWEKITNTKFDEAYKDPEAWRFPLYMNFIFNTAKAVGEDFSPKGGQTTGGEVVVGMQYKDMDKFKGG